MTERKNITKGDIANALHSTAADHVTAVAEDVFDENLQAYQSDINSTHKEELAKKANSADVTSKFTEEADRVNGELAKKANAEDVNNSMQELDKKLNRNLLAIEFDDETGDLNAILGQDTTIKSVSTDEDGNVIIEQEIS